MVARFGGLCALGLLWCLAGGVSAAEVDPATLQPIGGFWYVTKTEPAVYYYKDAGRYADLFSYHAKDSNQDGIPNLQISHDDQVLIIRSQGYPNHPTAVFPNSGNPNRIQVQDFTFYLPLQPKKSRTVMRVPMGPIGMAINGVVYFNPFEAGGMNAVEGYSEVWLDSCCGHPQQHGVYHYHKNPSCVKSPFPDDGQVHSPIIGFAFDGFPLYGPYEGPEQLAKDLKGKQALDVCNGHEDAERGYHYHVTGEQFPYILGGYAGVVDQRNFRHPLFETGAIVNNASGQSRLDKVITSIRPGNAPRGQTHQLTITLNPRAATRQQLPPGPPSWVQIGPYEAKSISRQGNNVTVEIALPAEASVGQLLDCHLEFDPDDSGRPVVFKANSLFRVVD